jgi:hypothetical protein
VEKFHFMEKARSHALNEKALKAVEQTWRKLNMGSRSEAPKLDELVDGLMSEMAESGETVLRNGNYAEAKQRMIQMARELLPQQIETIRRVTQQVPASSDPHGPEMLKRKRELLLAQLAKI